MKRKDRLELVNALLAILPPIMGERCDVCVVRTVGRRCDTCVAQFGRPPDQGNVVQLRSVNE